MAERYDDLPRWTFETEEVANGFYEVVGTDVSGRKVSISGTMDPEAALEDLRERAKRIDAATEAE